MNRNLWVYDIETLCSCFTYTAYNIDTKEVVQFAIFQERNDFEKLLEHLLSVKGLIGFNNLSFDYPVIHYILQYQEEFKLMTSYEVVNQIYSVAQDTINDEWSGVKDKYIKIPQLDLFKIWHYNNKARMTSLKKLQIALRYPNVQDMPYKHDDEIFYEEQLQEILDYNLNDVMSTYDFYMKTLEKIELRKGLYEKYGLKCMNSPDTKIGEDLTLKLYCDATGENPLEVRKGRTYRKNFKFIECFPEYLYFLTPEFNALQDYLADIEVQELKGSFAYSFEYKGFQFDLGTGGIHGCVKAGIYETTDTHIIVDVDVSSLYPSLAVVNRFYPEHLGEEFVDVYNEGIIIPRLEAKKAGEMVMANGFKLSANSVYGKSNSEYSWLYDPLYTLKTTLAGQLSLCMLSEKLMINIDDIKFLQINTDGLTVLIPKTEKKHFYDLCQEWEKETRLGLEYVAYDKMIIRDVNNYISLSKDGKVKRKGTFVTYQQMLKEESYHKSLSQAIVAEAVEKYFLDGIPVEETILKSNEIYDFCKVFNASHGWKCELVTNDGNIPQQKNNRYFISTDGQTFRKTKEDKVIEIEAGGKLVTIFNTYEKKPFDEYNIDYDYYINECYKIIHKVDGTEEKMLEELRIKRDAEKAVKEEANFLKYCVNKIPTKRQYEMYKRDWLIEKYGEPDKIK